MTAGVRRIDHVGITVPDLARARRFFIEALGFRPGPELGPISGDGNWMSEHLDADPGAVVRIQILHHANCAIELFGFASPRQNPTPPRRDDVGAASIGLEVDDLARAVEEVSHHGATILGEPKDVHEGPLAGSSWVYAKTDWGLLIFLIQKSTAG